MSVSVIIQRVQRLFEDSGGRQYDTDYIQGFLALHNEDVESYLESLDLSYDTAVIVLPAGPAGTNSLASFQADGQPLDMMMLPTALEWRLVGQDDTQWQPIPSSDKVLDVQTAAPGGPSTIEGISSYEWRGGTIYISASSCDVDIRVRCEDLPAVLDSDSATYIKGMTNVLAWGVASIIAFVRGGPKSAIGTYFKAKADDAMSVVADRMVKQEQVVPRRMAGRRSTVSLPSWNIPNSNNVQ